MKPADLSKGLEKFYEFHQLEPTKTGEFHRNFKIPYTIKCAGDALWIAYASKKWSGKRANYIHDHEYGVMLYRPDEGEYNVATPEKVRKAKTLVKLGECLGFGYKCNGEEIEGKTKSPYPELYCTCDGSVLLVIEDKSKLIAMLWGGHLDVKSQGIVG